VGPAPTEVLMTDGEGGILEGLVTNFFAVVRGDDGRLEVRTSGTGVLPGHMRRLALQACADVGARVALERPAIKDLIAGRFEAAFLTSTVRTLTPVAEIRSADGSVFAVPGTDGAGAAGALVARVRARVRALLAADREIAESEP
jgi:branched-subunit amino acid aminotransferase/4-amino-4-deoxychorismate lyase